ncbi:MAG: hypothetical protein PF542_05460 [Nanoarchaeota archaeon]|jgi:hypothetical protein|nr:hypothetical protein [Nanoarchaeota archaeon]
MEKEESKKVTAYRTAGLEEQKVMISQFWEKYFGITIRWLNMRIPESNENVNVLEYIPKGVTLLSILETYARTFNSGEFLPRWKEIAQKKTIYFEKRPDKDYVFRHSGGQDPQPIIWRKYEINSRTCIYREGFASREGLRTMLPIEYFIMYFRYRTQTGEKPDYLGFTEFNATQDVDSVERGGWPWPFRMDYIFRCPGKWCTNGRTGFLGIGVAGMLPVELRQIFL